MLRSVYQFFFFIHCLSIDVALGACGLVHAIAKSQGYEVNWYYQVLLFLSVLIVYWWDHLSDSQNLKKLSSNLRHQVFKTHRKLFQILLGIAALSGLILALKYLSVIEIVVGLVLVGLNLYYLLFHQKIVRTFILEKELQVAFLYTVSIFFAPVACGHNLAESNTIFIDFILFFLLFFAALQNLFSISIIEKESDQKNNIKNITQIFGSNRLRRLQLAILLLQCFLVFFLFLIQWFYLPFPNLGGLGMILLLISAFGFLLPVLFKKPNNSVYRILGEWVFSLAWFF